MEFVKQQFLSFNLDSFISTLATQMVFASIVYCLILH